MENQNKIGVVFGKTGNRQRGRVMGYHQKPSPLKINDTLYGVDIGMIPKKKQKEVISFIPLSTSNAGFTEFASSRFTIGFEIEKTSFARGVVKEYELFCGFETDSSCGYEAVTHILPLLPKSTWRMKIFDLMVKAKNVIDSPCDIRCGGHINIGVENKSGEQILQETRKYMGILYAIFRYRLTQNYCRYNPRLLSSLSLQPYTTDFTLLYHSKYRVALPKYNLLEIRLPSRVENVKQLMRRYELMYELVDTAFNSPKTTFKSFLKKVRPIIMRMYDNDEQRVDLVYKLAVDFQKYIDKGSISPLINPFLPAQTIG